MMGDIKSLNKLSQRFLRKIDLKIRRFEYIDVYRRDTDRRISRDPFEAVGGKWEELGQLQYNQNNFPRLQAGALWHNGK